MYKILTLENQKEWKEFINLNKNNSDIYFLPEYFKVSKYIELGEPQMFQYKCDAGKIVYPYILREIPFQESEEHFYDITTPYGYGGIYLIESNNYQELIRSFRERFSDYCAKNNIVSEFIRFHPYQRNYEYIEEYMNAEYIRNTIYINLKKEKEEFIHIFPSKTRNMIRRAKRNGIEIEKLDPEDYLEDFIDIYNSTMNRNTADDYYYFDKEYFKLLISNLKGNIHLFGAFYENKLIAATFILSHGNYIHYHLSGALKDYMSLGPNNLLLYKVAEWGKDNGYSIFHLGGGYKGNDDGLYKFKKSFTMEEPLKFYIGKKIHNQEIYDELVKYYEVDEQNNGFFPLYRS